MNEREVKDARPIRKGRVRQALRRGEVTVTGGMDKLTKDWVMCAGKGNKGLHDAAMMKLMKVRVRLKRRAGCKVGVKEVLKS